VGVGEEALEMVDAEEWKENCESEDDEEDVEEALSDD
jgi:hypothetical protein